MSTSGMKHITIIHQFQTLHEEASKEEVPKLKTHRVKQIVSIPKIPQPFKNDRQSEMSFIAQMGKLGIISRGDSQAFFQNRVRKKSQLPQRRLRFHTEMKKSPSSNMKTIQNSDPRKKIKRILLPNLKSFDDFDYQTDRIRPNQKKSITQHDQKVCGRNSLDKETNFPEVPKQKQRFSPFKSKQDISEIERKVSINAMPKNFAKMKGEKWIYKYIEKQVKSDHRNTKNLKGQKDDDDSRSVSQFSPKYEKQTNIIFHSFKSKQSDDVSKTNHSISHISEAVFDLQKIKQNLNDFIVNYTPLNPNFDKKGLIRNPNVQILATDKNVFIGQLVNGKMEGKGVLLTEKQHFEGEFSSNMKKQGFQKNKNGLYQGTYEEGKRSGNGKFIWSNGEFYEGEWRCGKKNGHGIWRSPKGDYYQGSWKDNLQNGKGCYYHKGCSIYRGYFKNSLKHGRGQQQFQNGEKYQGGYDSGKPHGYGKYTWANGDTYEGQFAKGSREGQGRLRKINGDRYQGHFKEDMKDGFGKETYATGEYFQGHFEKGMKISGSYFSKEGKEIQTY